VLSQKLQQGGWVEEKAEMVGAHRQGRDGRNYAHGMLFSLFCGIGQ